jgi:hypothetical protein
MALQIKQAQVDDINLVASLFNEYRIFYNQLSDIEGATNFYTNEYQKINLLFLSLLLMANLWASHKCIPYFHQCL